MDYQPFINNLDQKTINNLSTAVETGRWENGDKLTQKQLDSAMQAVMLWNAKHQTSNNDEPFKINKKGEFKIGKGATLTETPLEYKEIDDKNIIFQTK